MSKNIIDNTAVFTCNKGIGVSFAPIRGQMVARGEGKDFLNANTKCIVKGVGQCTLQPNPSGTGFLPCNQVELPITPWSGTDNIISIGGAKALTSDASTICPLGAKINLQSYCNTIFKVGCDFSIREISISSAKEMSENKHSINCESNNEHVDNTNKVLADKSSLDKQRSRECLEKEETDLINKSNDKYALCPYEQCNDKDNCPYFCAKAEVDNDSGELKNRFREDRVQEYNQYIELHNRLREEYLESVWGYETHHLISGNQVFMAGKSDKNEDMIFGHLLKLAYMCGYNINNSQNGILLPSIARKEDYWGNLDTYVKVAKAFDVMGIMKRQWHLGGHAYTIPKDSLKYYKPTDDQILSLGVNEYFPNYVTSVQAKLMKLNDIYSRSVCWKKRNTKKFREKFVERMNDISMEIEQALLCFEKNPKDSFPYFVSRQAVDYAYDAPRTGKIIILYKEGDNIYASKFRVSRKQKDNYQIIVNQNYEMPVIRITKDSMYEFVKYCENIRHFWIDSSIKKELPWDCSNEFISKRVIEGKNINDYANKNSTEIFTFIDKNRFYNNGHLAQIRKRWMEAKENVDFYD